MSSKVLVPPAVLGAGIDEFAAFLSFRGFQEIHEIDVHQVDGFVHHSAARVEEFAVGVDDDGRGTAPSFSIFFEIVSRGDDSSRVLFSQG